MVSSWLEQIVSKDPEFKTPITRNSGGKVDIADSGVDCDNSSTDVKISKLHYDAQRNSNINKRNIKTPSHVTFNIPISYENEQNKNSKDSKMDNTLLDNNVGSSSNFGLTFDALFDTCSKKYDTFEFVPMDILLTGSRISLTLYDKRKLEKKSPSSKVKCY